MSRPGREGGGAELNTPILPRMKWLVLRAFLTLEAARGNATAWKLLKDMPPQSGEVEA